MPGKRITDHQVHKYKQHRNQLSQVVLHQQQLARVLAVQTLLERDPRHAHLPPTLDQRIHPAVHRAPLVWPEGQDLGLRSRDELLGWIAQAGLKVLGRHDARPTHTKAQDATDPLHQARRKEVTSLWRVAAA